MEFELLYYGLARWQIASPGPPCELCWSTAIDLASVQASHQVIISVFRSLVDLNSVIYSINWLVGANKIIFPCSRSGCILCWSRGMNLLNIQASHQVIIWLFGALVDLKYAIYAVIQLMESGIMMCRDMEQDHFIDIHRKIFKLGIEPLLCTADWFPISFAIKLQTETSWGLIVS